MHPLPLDLEHKHKQKSVVGQCSDREDTCDDPLQLSFGPWKGRNEVFRAKEVKSGAGRYKGQMESVVVKRYILMLGNEGREICWGTYKRDSVCPRAKEKISPRGWLVLKRGEMEHWNSERRGRQRFLFEFYSQYLRREHSRGVVWLPGQNCWETWKIGNCGGVCAGQWACT